ncbi:MAG TPA: TadE/TadG family type IV pilus assembly protein [Chloroflexia bacterium]|nr:TadE/TadG family type IV pilus assembly protein [Chloroflexia bacterium]
MVELALLLPLLVLMLSIIIEGGLAFNAWERVNTASRDATRFMLDRGTQDQTVTLVLNKLQGIDFGTSQAMTGSLNLDIFTVQGATDTGGHIPNLTANWKQTQIYNGNSSSGDTPKVTRAAIETKLRSLGDPNSLSFVLVEVDFKYTPLLGSLIAPHTQLPMSNYAIIQQVPNN